MPKQNFVFVGWNKIVGKDKFHGAHCGGCKVMTAIDGSALYACINAFVLLVVVKQFIDYESVFQVCLKLITKILSSL